MKSTTIKLCLLASCVVFTTFTHAKSTLESDSTTDSLNKCYDQIGDAPRTAIQACLQSEFDKLEASMVKTFTDNESNLKEIDSSATEQAIKSLKSSQNDFLAYRKSECQRQGDALMGGSGSGDVMLACKIELTHARIQALANN